MPVPTDKPRLLLNDKALAGRLSMSASYVRGQRHRRKYGKPHSMTIEPVWVGKSPRYRETDVDAFVASLEAANGNNAADEGGQS